MSVLVGLDVGRRRQGVAVDASGDVVAEHLGVSAAQPAPGLDRAGPRRMVEGAKEVW